MTARGKPYKQAPPEETVARLRAILDEVGIGTAETERDTLSFHSGRVETADLAYPMLRMGANGKGMTREYSRASAHAEFFERLQNGNLTHPIDPRGDQHPVTRRSPGAQRKRTGSALGHQPQNTSTLALRRSWSQVSEIVQARELCARDDFGFREERSARFDVRALKRLRVDIQNMAAGMYHTDRNICRDTIEIRAM